VQALVKPDGTVKEVTIVGGHPLLADALAQAVKHWKYQPASKETVELVKFSFGPVVNPRSIAAIKKSPELRRVVSIPDRWPIQACLWHGDFMPFSSFKKSKPRGSLGASRY